MHPGNIILLRNNRFALIDLGAIGSVDSNFLDIYANMSRQIATGDYNKGLDFLLMMADKLEVLDIVPFKTEMVEAYRVWEAQTHLEGLTYAEKSVTGGSIAAELAELSARYRVGTSWQFLRITRAFSTMEVSLSALMGNTNPRKILKRYYRRSRRRA